MSNVPLCAKCNKPLSGKVKIVDGKRYHDPSCVPAQMAPEEVHAPAPDAAPEPAAKPPAPEMRHVCFFTYQGEDGTVFNHTVRGTDLQDFIGEFGATVGWVLNAGYKFVNTGRASATTAGAPVAAAVAHGAPSSTPSLPQSVGDQTTQFEADGVKYMVGKAQSASVKTTTKGDLYLNVVVPPFIKFGVPAYKEIAQEHFGDLQQLSGKPVEIPAEKQFVVFSLKEDGKPNKIVDFRATKGG